MDADLAIAQPETQQKRIVDAETRREAMIAEAEGQVKATVKVGGGPSRPGTSTSASHVS